MKAKEAPDKLYLIQHNGVICYCGNNENDIEYTRTDAFIEKAEEYMYKQLNEGCIECGDIKRFVEDFEEYLKK